MHSLGTTYGAAIIRNGGFGRTNYPVNSIAAFEKSLQMGNPDLKNELSTEIEIGTDLRFFNNRVGLDLTYYNNVKTNLIVLADIAASTGFLRQVKNLGKITNSGIEAKLD